MAHDLIQDIADRGLSISCKNLATLRLKSSDSILSLSYAKSLLYNGEVRRCLNALENFGFLSLESLKTVSVFLFGSSRENEDAYQQIYVILESFLLAIRCLSALNRFEDAVLLFSEVFREGMVTEEEVITLLQRSKLFQENLSSKLHVLSALFCLVGKCHNSVGNSEIAWNFMLTAVKLDCACLEAFEFLLNESDLSQHVSVKLFEFIRDHSVEREALVTYYKSILVDQQLTSTPKFKRSLKINFDQTAKAYNCFVNGLYEEAYRICREIYCCDPFDEQCLVIYIGSMVELSLKGELYYLGHELVSNFPKLCLSWYCIGCYYWTCSNYEVALKYIQKCTKMEKDKNYMWILLGHILSAQEENEQAIAAYRCAGRLKTTDHRPLIFMAKEFVKTNCLSLSFQTLRVASNICPSDPLVFNELGIVCERLGNLDMAQRYFQVAAGLLETASTQIESRRVRSFEVFNNLGSVCFRLRNYSDSIKWFQICVLMEPKNPQAIFHLAICFHLLQRFSVAIVYYHKALSLHPQHLVCVDMLEECLADQSVYFEEKNFVEDSSNPNSFTNMISRLPTDSTDLINFNCNFCKN